MKRKFIERYKTAVINYFTYTGDSDGKFGYGEVENEYRYILMEVFGMSEEEVSSIYDKLYFDVFDHGQIKPEYIGRWIENLTKRIN